MIKQDNKNKESRIVKKSLIWINLIGSFKRKIVLKGKPLLETYQ